MASIKCWECGREVSDQAAHCPSCGVRPKKAVARKGRLTRDLTVLLLCGLFIYYVSPAVFRAAPKTESVARLEAADDDDRLPDPGKSVTEEDKQKFREKTEKWLERKDKIEDERIRREDEEKKRNELEDMGLSDGKVVVSDCSEPDPDLPTKQSTFESCQQLTEELLKSLVGRTREQVVEIMGASGYVDGSILRFFCNYRHGGSRDEIGAGGIDLTFREKKVVKVHAAFRISGNLKEYEQSVHSPDYDLIGLPYCSDFPGSRRPCNAE